MRPAHDGMPAPHRAAAALPAALARLVPALALCAMGAGLLLVARSQPAWLGPHVGPGLMAQALAKGVLALGALWGLVLLLKKPVHGTPGCGQTSTGEATGWHAAALLGSVLLFGLTVPALGLVLAASLAAALAAVGAGERQPVALGLTVAGLGTMVAIIGVTLLPPTAPLWPWS